MKKLIERLKEWEEQREIDIVNFINSFDWLFWRSMIKGLFFVIFWITFIYWFFLQLFGITLK